MRSAARFSAEIEFQAPGSSKAADLRADGREGEIRLLLAGGVRPSL